jgi:hypothetical protein
MDFTDVVFFYIFGILLLYKFCRIDNDEGTVAVLCFTPL